MEKLEQAVTDWVGRQGGCPLLCWLQAMKNPSAVSPDGEFWSWRPWGVMVPLLGGNATVLKAGMLRREKTSMWPLSLQGLLRGGGLTPPMGEKKPQFSRVFLPLKLCGE